ncbi:MAG: hypothetical protein HY763_10455 [Planctomycetes bacterium]|nr:hypothetical protein [Planctomycetota bacterium]
MQRSGSITRVTAMGLLALGAVSPAAWGQSAFTGQTAAQNTRGGAVRSRAPGHMVSDGVARAIEFGNRAFAGVEITETEIPSSGRAQVLAAQITDLFDALNAGIQALGELIIQRAGGSSTLLGGLAQAITGGLGSTTTAPTTNNTTNNNTTTGGGRR